jgi:hypothetical protein
LEEIKLKNLIGWHPQDAQDTASAGKTMKHRFHGAQQSTPQPDSFWFQLLGGDSKRGHAVGMAFPNGLERPRTIVDIRHLAAQYAKVLETSLRVFHSSSNDELDLGAIWDSATHGGGQATCPLVIYVEHAVALSGKCVCVLCLPG